MLFEKLLVPLDGTAERGGSFVPASALKKSEREAFRSASPKSVNTGAFLGPN